MGLRIDQSTMLLIGMGLVAGAVVFVMMRGIKGVTSDIVTGVADAGAGVIVGLGEVVAIPATNQTRCEAAKAIGDTWEASKYCPAMDFVSYWWNK